VWVVVPATRIHIGMSKDKLRRVQVQRIAHRAIGARI
jgi:hypothetical protein